LAPNNYRSLLLAEYYAGSGDAAHAVEHLRKCLNVREDNTDRTLAHDPWWDKLRGQPEFDALLKERAGPEAKR
jgi:hypothetical protein